MEHTLDFGGDCPAIYTKKKDGVEVEQNDVAIWHTMAKGIEGVLSGSPDSHQAWVLVIDDASKKFGAPGK